MIIRVRAFPAISSIIDAEFAVQVPQGEIIPLRAEVGTVLQFHTSFIDKLIV